MNTMVYYKTKSNNEQRFVPRILKSDTGAKQSGRQFKDRIYQEDKNMKKRLLAVALSGALVLGGSMSAFAADAPAAESEAVSSEKGMSEGDLQALLGSLAGSSDKESGDLSGLLSMLGGEDGEVDLGGLVSSLGGEEGGLGALLGSLGGEEGGLGELLGGLTSGEGLGELLGGLIGEGGLVELLGGLTSGEGLGELLGSLTDGSVDIKGLLEGFGVKVSDEDIAAITSALSNPEALKEMVSGLFAKDGIGASILDMLGGKGGALGKVLDSLKGSDGGYDVDKLAKSLEGAEEKDGSVVINGTEIPEEELSQAVTDVLGTLGLDGSAESEAA